MAVRDETLARFARHYAINLLEEPDRVLKQVLRAFARLPYENLSKIVREAERGRVPEARRTPEEVITDHIRLGTGGTCFSLTATLLHIVRQLGWEAQPILADRPYGPDTHCALLLWKQGRPHLVDPGFLISDLIELPKEGPLTLATSFHNLELRPRNDNAKFDLYVVSPKSELQLRLTYKTTPVEWDEFLRIWDLSFDWEMMRYPLVTQVRKGEHIYLKGNRLQRRSHHQVVREELPLQELARYIHEIFGIAPCLVYKALRILKQRGEKYGQAAAS
ncbi:MAG: arylamine N-acetyltransferase [Gemmatales bacterium]|nr:arylamine N-acetyltransferase [Gemmatales bacterium]MDW7993112.1 arylamine N-acetyltransferase [Gemmatales bacterium]